MADTFSDPRDKKTIHDQMLTIEFMRDFIVWLCEEQCNSTVSEMEDEFKKYDLKDSENLKIEL